MPPTDTRALFVELAETAPDSVRRQAIRDELVARHLKLVTNIARKFVYRGEPLDDLVQAGTIGLINAIDRFDPGYGADFLSFAVPTVTGEIRNYFRDSTWSVRVPRRLKELNAKVVSAREDFLRTHRRPPRPSELASLLDAPVEEVREALVAAQGRRGSSLDVLLEDAPESRFGQDDAELDTIEARHVLEPLLAALPARERRIIVLRFVHHLSQSAIAERVGVSQMHVSRLLARSLRQMRTVAERRPGTSARETSS